MKRPKLVSDEPPTVLALTIVIGVATASILQVSIQPLLPFVRPDVFAFGGLNLVVAVEAFILMTISQKPWLVWWGGFMAVCASALLVPAVVDASQEAIAARQHCRTIEAAMLAPPLHVRADLPAVFTALGCKPQL